MGSQSEPTPPSSRSEDIFAGLYNTRGFTRQHCSGSYRVTDGRGLPPNLLLARYFRRMTHFISLPPSFLHQQYHGPLALDPLDQMARSHDSQVAKQATSCTAHTLHS